MGRFLAVLSLLALASPLAAKDSLGVFGDWGAFRDPAVPRCYAIAAADYGVGLDAEGHALWLGATAQVFPGIDDSNANGLPDWWEAQHGLDPQDATDAAQDLSGDGLAASDAYLRGLDPTQDARIPAVLTTELVIYPAGTTAILPDTTDIDTPPEQIVYTLTGLPAGGTLSLRQANPDPAHPDRVLVPGAQFTHADVLRGRLVFDHDGSGKPPGALAFAVSRAAVQNCSTGSASSARRDTSSRPAIWTSPSWSSRTASARVSAPYLRGFRDRPTSSFAVHFSY